jgi:hypothetical protein
MSDLLNSASLVLIPSGYKEDVVYSAVPTDGSGDLSFTRASNGTRINSAGLVEVCPWNEAQQSNTFGTSPWSNTLDTGATLTYTANYGIAPDGTTTAGRLQMALNGGAYAQKNQIISVITGQQYTYSVWIKSLSGTKSVIFCYDNTNNITASVTTEWQRFTHTFTGNSQVYARFVLEAGTSTSVDLLVYGAQLNIGSTAKPYFPTTDRLNVPRLTYQNGGGGCPSLLLEKQSTNVVTYSEQFDNADWLKNVSVTANATTSPDGTQNADKILENASSTQQWAYQSFAMSGAQTATIYAKKGERNYIAMATAGLDFSYFNLDTGVVVSTASGATTSIQSVGNGWYRCSVSSASSTSTYFIVAISDNGTRYQYAGDTSKGVYVWGAQNEASSYPTSYIPTTSASATRVADACSKTGISSLIGQTSGVVFWDIQVDIPVATGLGNILNIDGGSFNNTIYLYKVPAGDIVAEMYVSSVLQASFTLSSITAGRYKMAFAYALNNTAFFVNGTQVGTTDTSCTVPAMSRLQMGDGALGSSDGKVNQAVLFTTRLSNSECISLTTI